MDAEVQTFPLLGLRRGIGVFGRERRSAHRGDGYELVSSRPYRPGDNMRSIDWAASARFSSARDTDEFVVREHFAEESPRVVLLVDRRPAMRLYPPELPWLRKPAAMQTAGRMIVDSTLAAQGLAGYLDLADPSAPRWLPPRRRIDAPRIRDRELARDAWTAPEENLALGFDHCARERQDMPRGTFVFVLSDFLAPPPAAAWLAGARLDLDLVPVVVQDPTWEQSFPEVAGLTLPFATADGTLQQVRLTRREAAERRREHEERFRSLLSSFARLALDPVIVSSDDAVAILDAFLDWHDRRHRRLSRR